MTGGCLFAVVVVVETGERGEETRLRWTTTMVLLDGRRLLLLV